MSKVICKLGRMSITMPDEKSPNGVLTGSFTCPATHANMIDLKEMSTGDVSIECVQPKLFGEDRDGN